MSIAFRNTAPPDPLPVVPFILCAHSLVTLGFARRTRMMRKMEAMIPYWMARCPNYGWKESQEYFNAEDLREKMGAMESKAKKRWEANFC